MKPLVESPLMPNYGAPSVRMVKGEGVYLFDEDGREYLDFTAGIAVCSLGHCHPAVTDVIQRQAATLVHTSNLYGHPERTRLATRLTQLSGLDQVFFCNSGAEANEAALKLARKHAHVAGDPERTQVVSLPGGFHGRTFGALSVTPKPAYHEGFAPLVPDCVTPLSLTDVPDAITSRTAACIVEMIQGEGGVRPVPVDILHAIADRCAVTGALLIVDEVQTGVGRTGAFFAYESLGLRPDIVTMAKALGNGVPIGAVLAKANVAAAFTAGSHGSTFGGNPLATAVANTVLDVVATPDFLYHVREVGHYLEERLREAFDEVTGAGLMWGFRVPDAATFVKQAADAGLLVTAVGTQRIRMVPPLILSKEHVDEAFDRMRSFL